MRRKGRRGGKRKPQAQAGSLHSFLRPLSPLNAPAEFRREPDSSTPSSLCWQQRSCGNNHRSGKNSNNDHKPTQREKNTEAK